MVLGRGFIVLGFATLVACSGSSTGAGGNGAFGSGNGSGDGGTSSTDDPASCGSQPKSQPVSSPCCTGYGIDACGADLFCAAFDGRKQATCYPVHSRLAGETCTADDQCATLSCNTTAGKCKALPGTKCDLSVGCANDESGDRYECNASHECIDAGYGLVGQWCASSSDCQANVGLECDTANAQCVPANPSTSPYCDGPSQTAYRYGQCQPDTSGSFTYTKACTMKQDPETGQIVPGVACPSGTTCQIGISGSFTFCE